jgi:Kef-type K+ transport system membrane component KefB
VLASAVAVTSIPVISRIFTDLGIMHTRFASLILGSAVLEDIALWGVLAVATALTKDASLAGQGVIGESTRHIAIAIGYMGGALLVAPHLLRRLRGWRWNILYRASPLAYAVVVMFAYVGVAATLGVNLVFAAFLAGFGLSGGLPGGQRHHYAEALDAIYKVAFAVFVPIYFGLVGHRLVFGREFSPTMFLVFLIASSLVALISVGGAARLAGFRGLDIINLSITNNARGGPGIVLASVAYDAGIINAPFYTTLVLTAIVTSQIAGMWLRFVLNRGWPLLSTDPEDRAIPPNVPTAPASMRELRPQHA